MSKPSPAEKKKSPTRETWVRLTTAHGPAAVELLVTESLDGEVVRQVERQLLYQSMVRSAAMGRGEEALNDYGGAK